MTKRLSGPLSPNEIEDRFEEAAHTLRRLPDDKPQDIFGMIARGAGIDTTIPRTLAFERTTRRQRAFDARTRRETADPRAS